MSRALSLIVLYTALSLGANAALAADPAALRDSGLRGLVVYDQPLATPDLPFNDADGRTLKLSDYRGRALLVNFWATWCVPCRAEMPTLDALQQAAGGAKFQVLTIASGRNPQGLIQRFFAKAKVTALPRLQDESQGLARAMGVVGLPVSVLIDAQGREVARMIGEADWASPAARAAVAALIAAD